MSLNLDAVGGLQMAAEFAVNDYFAGDDVGGGFRGFAYGKTLAIERDRSIDNGIEAEIIASSWFPLGAVLGSSYRRIAGFCAGISDLGFAGESIVPVELNDGENESVAGPACLLHHMDSSYKSHWRKRTGQQCSP